MFVDSHLFVVVRCDFVVVVVVVVVVLVVVVVVVILILTVVVIVIILVVMFIANSNARYYGGMWSNAIAFNRLALSAGKFSVVPKSEQLFQQ